MRLATIWPQLATGAESTHRDLVRPRRSTFSADYTSGSITRSDKTLPKALTSVEELGMKLDKCEQGCVGEVVPNGSPQRPPQLRPDKDVTPSTRTKEQQSQLDCKCGLLLLFFPLLLANHVLLDECLF